MPALSSKAPTLLSSTSCNMQDAAGATINPLFTVPVGKVLRISHIVVRDASASLATGTSFNVTGWRQTFSLANLTTTNTGYIQVNGADLAQYTEQAANTIIYLFETTGTTGAATATVDLFGTLL